MKDNGRVQQPGWLLNNSNQHIQAIPSRVLTQVQAKIDEVSALLAVHRIPYEDH